MFQPKRVITLCALAMSGIVFSGCATTQEVSVSSCQHNAGLTEGHKVLDAISLLYANRCYADVITWGSWVRENFRDKKYSLIGETFEFFFPEGTFTPYVMESYERSYLALLMASSYLNMDAKDKALVELRRSMDENKSLIYNWGEDPIILILQAAMWENLHDPQSARALWKRASEHPESPADLKAFSEQHISQIDSGHTLEPWTIYTLRQFPRLDWKTNFKKSGNSFYDITAADPFPESCQSSDSLIVSTETWLKKLQARYSYNYHPLLNVRSWTRLPIGVVYGAAVVTGGVGGGAFLCTIGSDNSSGRGPLCEAGARLAAASLPASAEVFEGTVRPDLRHWNRVPAAFVLQKSKSAVFCLPQARQEITGTLMN